MNHNHEVKLIIDGKPINVEKGTSLMEAIRLAGTQTPTICFHEATSSEGLCRLCVVEVEGWRTLAPACITEAGDGMQVKTNTERVNRSRRTILEMLNSSVDLSEAPAIQEYCHHYSADPNRFPEVKDRNQGLLDDNPFYIRDYNKCLLCWRCVQACGDDIQFTYAITLAGRGFDTRISTFFETSLPETTCVFCGNCVAVCPTNALKGKTEFFLEQGLDFDAIRREKRSARKSQKGQT